MELLEKEFSTVFYIIRVMILIKNAAFPRFVGEGSSSKSSGSAAGLAAAPFKPHTFFFCILLLTVQNDPMSCLPMDMI